MKLQLGLILIIAIAGCECASKAETYRKEPAFAEQMCHADQVNFTAVTPNAVSCARKCGETPGCESLIYLPGNNTCFGIKSDNPFNMSTPLPGAEFYTPTSVHVTAFATTASSSSGTLTSSQTPPPQTTTKQPTTTPPLPPTTTEASAATTAATTTTTTTAEVTTPPPPPTTTATTTTTAAATTAATTTTAEVTTPPPPPTTTATTTTTAAVTTPTTTTTTVTVATSPASPTTTITTTTAASTTTTYGPGTPLTASLPVSQFSASTTFSSDYGPEYAKLSNTATSWSAETGHHNTLQWIQVDFSSQVLATTVITTGEAMNNFWVSSYKVLTSAETNCAALVTVEDGLGNDMVFPGNYDQNTEVANALDPPVQCRCLRIKVESFVEYVTLRFEVLGHWL